MLSFAELQCLGLSPRMIKTRVAHGWLVRVHRGVYALGTVDLSFRGRMCAALLAGGETATLSHRAAAAVWSLLPPPIDVVDLIVPTQRRDRDGLRFHETALRRGEARRHHGLAVTSLPRTLFDIAASEPCTVLDRAVHEAEVQHRLRPSQIMRVVDAHVGRPGAARLMCAAADLDPGAGKTREELEKRFALWVRTHAIPKPKRNHLVEIEGERFSGDAVWVEARLVIELDGFAVHGTRRAFHSDRRRDRRFTSHRWIAMRATWADLDGERGDELAADVLRVLDRSGSYETDG